MTKHEIQYYMSLDQVLPAMYSGQINVLIIYNVHSPVAGAT